MPDSELRDIGCRYVDLPQGLTSAHLLAEVRSFDAASRAGDFYEDFAVNSRNFSELRERPVSAAFHALWDPGGCAFLTHIAIDTYRARGLGESE